LSANIKIEVKSHQSRQSNTISKSNCYSAKELIKRVTQYFYGFEWWRSINKKERHQYHYSKFALKKLGFFVSFVAMTKEKIIENN
jgi:hypothetical protein